MPGISTNGISANEEEPQDEPLYLEHATRPEPDTILQVRSGQIKALGKAGLLSAIFKEPQQGEVFVSPVGLAGDQQQYENHGGVDKALHQYSRSHYPKWRNEKPDKAHLFNEGAFGENLVAATLTEDNVCIGDIFQLGENVFVEVSEPRLPCYKLNTRFEWNSMSKQVQKTGRIGWYFRVLQTGSIKEGDMMSLLSRPNPRWTVTNSLRVLIDNFVDPRLLAEFSQLDALGKEMKDKAADKLKGKAENAKARLQGVAFNWRMYRLVESTYITRRVKQMVFQYDEPNTKISSHSEFGNCAYVHLRFGLSGSFERSYSVVSGNIYKFTLGIALVDKSRGGSKYLHQNLKVGDRIDVARGFATQIQQHEEWRRAEQIDRHVFIIGGIGVTAFLREIEELKRMGCRYEAHYAVRSLDDAAYKDLLCPARTHFYSKDKNQRFRVEDVIPGPLKDGKFHAMIFCSGPKALMEACEKRTQKLNYPEHLVHFESFGDARSGPQGGPFDVEVEETAKTLHVPSEKTILEVLNDAGFDVPSSCQVGKCGICTVDLCRGEVEHKGAALPEEAKATTMLSCVSRGKGRIRIGIEE